MFTDQFPPALVDVVEVAGDVLVVVVDVFQVLHVIRVSANDTEIVRRPDASTSKTAPQMFQLAAK